MLGKLKGGAKSKALTINQVSKILEIYGRPTSPIKTCDLEKSENEKWILATEELNKLKKKSADFYLQWKEFVIDNYSKGNTCGVCLSCYTFLTRRKRV
jgi:hypothetical protein